MTEEGDLGFCVYYVDEREQVDLVTNIRLESHLMMEEGHVVCTRPAICKFIYQLNAFHLLIFITSRCRPIRQQLQLPAI